jgi:uncharacterized membrane protein
MNAFNWKFVTPLALVVLMVTAVVEKLAVEQGWPRLLVHSTANLLIVIGTLLILRTQAASARRRLEGIPEAPVTRPEVA